MRRGRAIFLLGLLIFIGALIATWTVAYRAGEGDGRGAVQVARSAFATRSAGLPAAPSTTGNGAPTTGGRGGQGGSVSGAPAQGSAPSGGGAGSTGAAGSPTGGGRGNAAGATGFTGRVTKIDGQTITLQQTDNSTVSVMTTTDTTVRKLVAGSLSDLKAGDAVLITGARTGDSVAATAITQVAAGGGGGANGTLGARGPGAGAGSGAAGAGIIGSIKAIDGVNVSVQAADGTMLSVKTDATTVVRMMQPGTLLEIKVGDFLMGFGEKTGDTAYLARTITNQGAAPG